MINSGSSVVYFCFYSVNFCSYLVNLFLYLIFQFCLLFLNFQIWCRSEWVYIRNIMFFHKISHDLVFWYSFFDLLDLFLHLVESFTNHVNVMFNHFERFCSWRFHRWQKLNFLLDLDFLSFKLYDLFVSLHLLFWIYLLLKLCDLKSKLISGFCGFLKLCLNRLHIWTYF